MNLQPHATVAGISNHTYINSINEEQRLYYVGIANSGKGNMELLLAKGKKCDPNWQPDTSTETLALRDASSRYSTCGTTTSSKAQHRPHPPHSKRTLQPQGPAPPQFVLLQEQTRPWTKSRPTQSATITRTPTNNAKPSAPQAQQVPAPSLPKKNAGNMVAKLVDQVIFRAFLRFLFIFEISPNKSSELACSKLILKNQETSLSLKNHFRKHIKPVSPCFFV